MIDSGRCDSSVPRALSWGSQRYSGSLGPAGGGYGGQRGQKDGPVGGGYGGLRGQKDKVTASDMVINEGVTGKRYR